MIPVIVKIIGFGGIRTVHVVGSGYILFNISTNFFILYSSDRIMLSTLYIFTKFSNIIFGFGRTDNASIAILEPE